MAGQSPETARVRFGSWLAYIIMSAPRQVWPKAEAYLRRGQYEKALAVLDQGVAIKPDHAEFNSVRAEVHRARAEVHQKSGANEKALADLTRLIEIEPNGQGGFLNRALLYENLGKLDLAIADYDKLLSFAPNEHFYVERRSALLEKKGAAPATSLPKPPTPVTTTLPTRSEKSRAASEKKSAQKSDCKVYVPAANLTVSIPCRK